MVSAQKQQLVEQLVSDIKEYPLVGLVNFEHLPAKQLQVMRAMLLRSGVIMKMARKKLLGRALTQSGKKNIADLESKAKGLPALLFSKGNPFTLYATIQKNKSPAPAKMGQKAPKDILVKAGATNFAPGPIISELAAVGIKTKVENGKLAILKDTIVVKEGETITGKVAETLKRLDIQPMEIGLDLVAVWENGLVFEAKQLFIDEAAYQQDVTQAAQWAFNLAVEVAYPTSETTEMLLAKAFKDAKAVALEAHIVNDITAGDLFGTVERQALSLKREAGIETDDRPKPVEESAPAKKDENTEQLSAGAESIIQAMKDQFEPAGTKKPVKTEHVSAEKLVDEEKERVALEKDKPVEETEKLLNELMKKGTLRK